MKIAITGHRPDKILNSIEWITTKLDKIFTSLQPELIITGMALGVDQLAAEVAILNNIPILAAIPFTGQDSKWTAAEKENYRQLLSKAQTVEILANQPTSYFEAVKLLHARNKWMVDHCDLLVAVWNGSKGGTAHCVSYAKRVQKKKQLTIINLDPDTKAIAKT